MGKKNDVSDKIEQTAKPDLNLMFSDKEIKQILNKEVGDLLKKEIINLDLADRLKGLIEKGGEQNYQEVIFNITRINTKEDLGSLKKEIKINNQLISDMQEKLTAKYLNFLKEKDIVTSEDYDYIEKKAYELPEEYRNSYLIGTINERLRMQYNKLIDNYDKMSPKQVENASNQIKSICDEFEVLLQKTSVEIEETNSKIKKLN